MTIILLQLLGMCITLGLLINAYYNAPIEGE